MQSSWIHTKRTPIGSTAVVEMRFGTSLSAPICANFDNSNGYCGLQQPKLGGLDRSEKEM